LEARGLATQKDVEPADGEEGPARAKPFQMEGNEKAVQCVLEHFGVPVRYRSDGARTEDSIQYMETIFSRDILKKYEVARKEFVVSRLLKF